MLFPKFLSHIPAPLGIVLILLAIAFYKRSRVWIFVSAAMLALLSSSFFSGWILGSLENRYPVIPPSAAIHTDAIVILGGITRTTQTHANARFDLSDSAERIDEGIRLFHAGIAPLIVLTSGRHPPETEEGDHLDRYLLEHNVPATNVIHTRLLSHNTDEEAANVQDLLQTNGWHQVTLVTSAFHMPRAMMLFHKAKVSVIPHPVDFRSYRDPLEPKGNGWFPRADFLNQTELALREYYGILYYKFLALRTPATP